MLFTTLLMKEPEHPVETAVQFRVQEPLRALLSNKRYLPTVIGGSCLSFSMVGMAVWLPTFLANSTGLSLAQVNRTLGLLTVVNGVLGVVAGGLLADRWLLRNRGALYLVSAVSMILGAVAGIVVLAGPAALAFPAVAATQLFLFLNTAPMGAAILNSVSSRVRASALALSMFVAHAVGDDVSPIFIGWVADHSSLRQGMELALLPLALGAFALMGGARAMQQGPSVEMIAL